MNRKLRFVLCLAIAFAWLSWEAVPASAQMVTSTSANLVEIAAPASIVEGALEEDDNGWIFEEQLDFLLTSDLSVDADNAGASIDSDGDGGDAGIISAGTRVSSFMVFFDPEGDPTTAVSQQMNFAFVNTDLIVGLIYSDGLLDASDYLGAPGTTYPTGETFRGTTGFNEGSDSIGWFQFFAMGVTQSVTVENDQLRVILQVPEPASIGLAASALSVLLAFAVLRRKK